MFKVTALAVVLVFYVNADPLTYNSCYYIETSDGPSSVDLEKTSKGWQLHITFFGYKLSDDSPLKIKLYREASPDMANLIDVRYPIKDNVYNFLYTKYNITVPVPETTINNDTMKFILYQKHDYDDKEVPIWCINTSVKALHGIAEPTEKPVNPSIQCGVM